MGIQPPLKASLYKTKLVTPISYNVKVLYLLLLPIVFTVRVLDY